ncbi:glycerate kinase type-2 family protein [Halorubrum vacuolatum]|uniref:Hydroxypyruvate reductase n=1 Tax=Halorubrum vacuolatum TaxID=63740 RepID=A0A238VMC9_HALVU|nr:DUF4147 domain-containing protein [Halorubrum vacuolatum]SNR34893.1 hydroxypyruvate reductase [Halorubrum vacuolatum]
MTESAPKDAGTVAIEDRDRLARTPAHALALDCLSAGIEAAHPRALVEESIDVTDGRLSVRTVDGTEASYDLDAYDRVVLLGGGNAAGTLAAALEDVLGDRLAAGVVVTDAPVETQIVEQCRGDHPIPTERGVHHTRRVLDMASAAGPDDLVIAGITGGASALLAAPAAGIELPALRTVTNALIASGATIAEINAVRKHCSDVKGGRLARAAAPATVVTLVVSDVVGDDPSVIGSGPTVPDPSTYAEALDVLDRYGIDAPAAIGTHLQAGGAGDRPETPVAGDPIFDRVGVHVIGNGRTAIRAARDVATAAGYRAVTLAGDVEGEASDVGGVHAAIATECRREGGVAKPPCVLLSGGEATVTLGDDHGVGGPNQEFATACGLAIEAPGIVVAAVDTDGIDGPTDAAGALVDASTFVDRRDGDDGEADNDCEGGDDGEADDDAAVTVDAARAALDGNDVTTVLRDAGALLETGPTGTNVNDLRVIVVEGRN